MSHKDHESTTTTAPFPIEKNENSHIRIINENTSEPKSTFFELAKKSKKIPVLEKINNTAFHIFRDVLESNRINDNDDTILESNISSNIRVFLMVTIPTKDTDDEEVPLVAIRRINTMFKSLSNKISPVRIGLWNPQDKENNNFLRKLPEDVDIVERYAHDYNRFISPGKIIQCRLNVFYDIRKLQLQKLKE